MLPFLSSECLEAMLDLLRRSPASEKKIFATDLAGKIALTSGGAVTQEAAVQAAPAEALDSNLS
jgi:hypothetical protein